MSLEPETLANAGILRALNINLSKLSRGQAQRLALVNAWLAEENQAPVASTRQLSQEQALRFCRRAFGEIRRLRREQSPAKPPLLL